MNVLYAEEHEEGEWVPGQTGPGAASSSLAAALTASGSTDHRDVRSARTGGEEDGGKCGAANAAPAQLRLVKLASDVLPAEQTVAIIDADHECVSIGRDRTHTARVRLPAMEVSKHHANIFPVGSESSKSQGAPRAAFAITDTGSMHGTYILAANSAPSTKDGDSLPSLTAYERLAPPKKASAPRLLEHHSLLRVGCTVFQVHYHAHHANVWTLSCSECAIREDGSNEIPLHSAGKGSGSQSTGQAQHVTSSTSASAQRASHALQSSGDRKIDTEALRRQAMKELRDQHLRGVDEAQRAVASPSSSITAASLPATKYVDRAAARRARVGFAHGVGVGEAHLAPKDARPEAKSARDLRALPAASMSLPPEKQEQPIRLDDASNRGFKLFAAMGGARGVGTEAQEKKETPSAPSASGRDDAPATVIAWGVEGRAGLGSKRLLSVEELASRERQEHRTAQRYPYDADEVRARQRRRFEEADQRPS